MPLESSDIRNNQFFTGLKCLIHLIAAAQFWFSIYYDFAYVNTGYYGFGGKFRYITIIGEIWQAFYFTLCVLNDHCGTNESYPRQPSKLRRFKDYVFAAFSFPLATTICVSYWIVHFVDGELLSPKATVALVPGWLNVIMHTNILIFAFIELILSFRQYPRRLAGVAGLLVFLVAYMVWVHLIKYMTGKWVYTFLNWLNVPQRLAFMAIYCVCTVCVYFVGEFLNKIFWAKELKFANSNDLEESRLCRNADDAGRSDGHNYGSLNP